jgi:hypothetical protein
MKSYAIKTPKGYLATQGIGNNEVKWFESAPVGWSRHSCPDHAQYTLARLAKSLDLNLEQCSIEEASP